MRLFQKNGHEVAVVMTRAATRIIAPLTFATFAPGRVFSEMFADGQDPLLHINLARENDLLLVAPATANLIGKMANGIADDLLSTLFCAFYRRVVVAPAMNTHMLENPAVVENIARLRGRGVEIIEAATGQLANLETGRGRLPDAATIYDHCLNVTSV
jgi:phosphopantothenoylcysteine decarboxylase/phosphopantothenate--cysteine ligase